MNDSLQKKKNVKKECNLGGYKTQKESRYTDSYINCSLTATDTEPTITKKFPLNCR